MRSPEAGAFLSFEGKIWTAEIPESLKEIASPVTSLIEAIYRVYPDQARLILRSRIFYNYDLTPACEGMLRIAAKRWSRLEQAEFELQIARADLVLNYSVEVLPAPVDVNFLGQRVNHDQVVSVLRDLEERVLKNTNRFLSARPVAALVLDSSGVVLANAWNQNALLKIQHAEFNLIRSWWLRRGESFPASSSLYLSLEPCEMCAGLIHRLCNDPEQFSIYFLKPELGPSARHSVLRKMKFKNYSIHSSVEAQEHIKFRSP